MTYYTVPSTHWKVVNTISYKELTQDINQVILIIIGSIYVYHIAVCNRILYFNYQNGGQSGQKAYKPNVPCRGG